jgi:AhpD family alkylhydroperoxidase
MSLATVEWDACVLEPHPDRELEEYIRRGFGNVPSSVAYFTSAPWIVRAMLSMSSLGSPLVHVDQQLSEVIGLVVSQDNSCRYCYGIQRLMLRVFGVAEARIQRLEQGLLDAEIDPHAKAALEFARRLSRAAPLVSTGDAQALLATGWTPVAIRELAFESSFHVFMNRLMTVPAIPYAPTERLGDIRGLRWFGPLIRFDMKRRIRRARARFAPLPPEQVAGPFEYLVRALGALGGARALREALVAAFDSPVLSRRAKWLIFAIVARGNCGKPDARRRAGSRPGTQAKLADPQHSRPSSTRSKARWSRSRAARSAAARCSSSSTAARWSSGSSRPRSSRRSALQRSPTWWAASVW